MPPNDWDSDEVGGAESAEQEEVFRQKPRLSPEPRLASRRWQKPSSPRQKRPSLSSDRARWRTHPEAVVDELRAGRPSAAQSAAVAELLEDCKAAGVLRHALYENQLQAVGELLYGKRFLGVLKDKNKIPESLATGGKCCIFNLAEEKGPYSRPEGTHWVALNNLGMRLLYASSLGELYPPPNVVKFAVLHPNTPLDTLPFRFQSGRSEICGWYSLLFLQPTSMAELTEIALWFTPEKDYQKNDQILVDRFIRPVLKSLRRLLGPGPE